jgi:uridine monophosphate synthetase
MQNNIKKLVLDLYEIEAIKFGQFKLKSGIISPFYIDLRVAVSYPKVLVAIAELIYAKINTLNFDFICGVPYNAIPIASIIAAHHLIPMVMRRKEAKEYGTKKMIEGVFASKQKCLVIDDIITSGSSIFETIEPITAAGLVVKDVAVLVDREQNGETKLAGKGYNLHAVVTISQMLAILLEAAKIDLATAEQIKQFLQKNQFGN